MAERVQNTVLLAFHKGVGITWRRSRYNIDISGELVAKVIEREVVDIVAEGVLNLLADVSKSQDNICGNWYSCG
jgi:hypothetical protein